MIFVCGVHGVGKDFYCEKLSADKGIPFYSAGNLISCVKKDKKVDCVAKNQNILIEKVSQLEKLGQNIILAGNCCLINGEGSVERIDLKVFQKMNISEIIVLTLTPEKIVFNLKERDNQEWDINFVKKFQEEEVKYSKEISEKLGIKYHVVNNDLNFFINHDKTNSILLPIKPVFAEAILSNKKKYEYRRKICKRPINKIYIYATAPVKAIVGEVEVLDKLTLRKNELWEKTKNESGISFKYYQKYFSNDDYASAYSLGKTVRYKKPIDLSDLGIRYYPQSFVYMK